MVVLNTVLSAAALARDVRVGYLDAEVAPSGASSSHRFIVKAFITFRPTWTSWMVYRYYVGLGLRVGTVAYIYLSLTLN